MNSCNSLSSHDSIFPDLTNRLISFHSIMLEPLPPIEWLVEPLIPTGTRTIVFGEFGSMKSWTLLDLSLHIAAGRSWVDRFAISGPKSVLYIDEEMSEHELRRRVKRLGEGLGLKETDIPFRAVSHLNVRFDEARVESLLAGLRQANFDPEIIVVETFRRVLIGSENEAVDVGDFWHSIEPIRVVGKTLIVSHHMRKPNAQGRVAERHLASGSTDILAGADAAYAIKRKDDELTITCVKNRVAEEIDPFHVRIEDGGTEDGPVIFRYVGHPLDTEEPSKVKQAKEAIVAFLSDQPSFTAKREDILGHLEQCEIKERTGERALKELCDEGVIEKTDRGLYHLQPGLKAV